MSQTPLERFHPAVAAWFGRRFQAPTGAQAQAWPSILDGRSTLVAAPTGSGKTLAAFLAAIDGLLRQAVAGRLEDATQVVYVSPLKALSNDIERNLQEPLAGISDELAASGLTGIPPIRVLVRTGDTPAGERAAMLRRPPHILVTTPESLYILLTSEGGRKMLRTTRTVIVDEIHALVDDKRGSHLALSLERLESLAGETRAAPERAPLIRIGCSATQSPIEDAARFLVGAGGLDAGGGALCTLVDTGHARDLDLAIEVPGSPLQAVMPNEVWEEIHDRLATLIQEHRTTLVFVNTRRLSERLSRHLSERLGAEHVTAHHGSLSRQQRLAAEQRLKSGSLRALVATASLELGIDIGSVDLVCQIGSTRSIAVLLQRIGRSGHSVGGFPKGRLFPLTRDELVECAALLQCVRRGELDRFSIPRAPLDILAQQIVAAVACEEWGSDDLYALVRRAFPYRELSREDFDQVVTMLAEGFSLRRGRKAAYLFHDRVHGRLRPRKGARLTAITSGGAIPDTADYDVLLEPEGTVLGKVNEDFAIESMAGDIFQLGNLSWRIRKIEPGKVRVEDARGQPPGIPFWLGEAPARTDELSAAVSRLREDAGRTLEPAASDAPAGPAGPAALRARLEAEAGLPPSAASQIADYLAAGRAALGVLPTQKTLVLERFFDESGGMQLVLHSPFGRRINRAWGLALRKRFCRKFNIELQAAATEDAIVLSLGPSHSFPLEDVFRYLRSASVRDVLVQALLDAPMFTVRWRWNASRALAVPRFRGGRRTPAPVMRMLAEDLIVSVFPDQIACAENLSGERRIPDHPLVRQTIGDCLDEAMDLPGLERLLAGIEQGERALVARDVREPSPLAQEILNARPYAFLDGAPLEERRTQAVYNRRWLDVAAASDLGSLDAAAIDKVRDEAWPRPGSADEMHEALDLLGFLTDDEVRACGREDLLRELEASGRAGVLRAAPGGPRLWVAPERLPHLLAAFPAAILESDLAPLTGPGLSREAALAEVLRGRLEALGPMTSSEMAASCGLAVAAIDAALLLLEAEGFVLRGRFRPGAEGTEWCARTLLARIHRLTLNRLRSEIEPVSAADFMRFLFAWQRLAPGERAAGPAGLAAILEGLEGFEAPAAAWEGGLLPSRLERYDPAWLDALCLSGRFVWARLSLPRGAPSRSPAPVRSTPIALVQRTRLAGWISLARRPDPDPEPALSSDARTLFDLLAERGALFFAELAAVSCLLPSRVEPALAELAARGLITSDGFTGLRALITPSSRRPSPDGGRRRRATAPFGMESAGRWTRLPAGPWTDVEPQHAAEMVAPVLLRRYGIVFRRLLDAEGPMPPWRDLLRAFWRMEARGEIRGGRFVSGMQGEQFALPEAIERLRSVRRSAPDGGFAGIGAADPLNLTGIVVPGARVSPLASSRVLFRDGLPIAVREAREVRMLVDLEPAEAWRARNSLLRRSIPAQVSAYLGHTAW